MTTRSGATAQKIFDLAVQRCDGGKTFIQRISNLPDSPISIGDLDEVSDSEPVNAVKSPIDGPNQKSHRLGVRLRQAGSAIETMGIHPPADVLGTIRVLDYACLKPVPLSREPYCLQLVQEQLTELRG